MTAERDRDALDPDRALALVYVPARRRGAVSALWQLDAKLGSVLRAGGDRMIARIKLAWWRDSLAALDAESPPDEPILASIAQHVLPLNVSGAELAELEMGWSLLLDHDLESDRLAAYASERGGRLFALTARLLSGGVPADVEAAGEAWALTNLARNISSPREAEAALEVARVRVVRQPIRWEPPMRPLGMLAVVAVRDATRGLEPYGAPGRVLRMLRHRLTGR